MPTLRVIHRSSVLAGRELAFQEPVIKLGREPGSHVLFDEAADRSVSRNHAEIRWDASGPVLYPLAGKIILIRNRPINVPTPLKSGDILEFSGPGGPSVEVLFELAPQVGKSGEFDPSAATMFEMNPTALAAQMGEAPAVPAPPAPPPAAPAPAAAAEPPPERKSPPPAAESSWAAAPPPPAVNLPAIPPPARQAEEKGGTAFIPALDAAALAQFDKKQAPVPVETASRRNLTAAIAVGAGVLAIAAGVGFWWSAREREERVRLAVERVEALLAAEDSSGVVPEVSDEDMRLFEEEVKAKRHAAPAVAIQTLRTAPRKKAAARPPAAVAARPDVPPTPEQAQQRATVRTAFAAYQRAQIARLAEGNPKETTRLKELIEEVKKAQGTYEEAAKALPTPAGDEIDALLRSIVRHLGECDALMPERFRTMTRQQIEAFKTDKARHDNFVTALKRATDFRYTPTITAALADQGMPVELFFIPLRMSGLDERRVELPTPNGIPKGMWALLPSTAKNLGLVVGKAKDSLDADPTDERQHYERESKKVAKGMRLVFLKKAAGSSLLFMATWDHGDTDLLSKVKERAGLDPMESDPELVSFWKLWEAGKLSEEVKMAALDYAAMATIAEKPDLFGFTFAPPLEHVALAEKP